MNNYVLLIFLLAATLFNGCKSVDKPAIAPFINEPQVAHLKSDQLPSKIEFGSCAHPRFPQPIWTAMLELQPDLYLGLGDNVYAARPDDRPVEKMYALQAQIPEFRQFRAQVPILATWDDHDFGESDGGIENAEKDKYKSEFLKFFPDSSVLIPSSQSGVYHSQLFGSGQNTLQILVLDTRYYRSSLEKQDHPKNSLDIYKPTQDRSKTFLGAEQWQWLENELKKPAAFTIIVSSVQVIHQDQGFEKWANFPHERARLIELLRKYKKKNVVFISGDRHQGEIHKLNVKGLGIIYDLTASGINRVSTISEEPSTTRVGSFYSKENFGLFEFDWSKRQVQASIRDIKGKTVQTITLSIKP